MRRKSSAKSFMKGVGTGVVAGMAIATTSSMLMKSNKKMSRSAGNAVKAIGDFVSNVNYMMK